MTPITLGNGDKQVTLTEGSSDTLPDDWNPDANTVECYASGAEPPRDASTPQLGGNATGCGGGGGGRSIGTQTHIGGGGGAYASKANVGGTAGATVSYQIGQPGSGATPDTWFMSSSTVKADGTSNHIGGSVANSVGDVKYRGGNSHFTGKGGGGGAGPGGNGGDADAAGNGGLGNGGLAGNGGAFNTSGEEGQATGGSIVVTYTPV